MEITYNFSDLVLCRRNELTVRRLPKIDYYYATAGPPLIGVFAGVFILITTTHTLLGLWVMLMAGSFLAKIKTHHKFYQQIFYPPGTDKTTKQVNLKLTPDGMEETIGGVTSFAPWSSVTETELLDNLLVIRLSSKQEALIPENPPHGLPLDIQEIRDCVIRLKSAAMDTDSAAENGPRRGSPL